MGQHNSPFSTPQVGPQRRVYHEANGQASAETVALPSEPPSSILAPLPTADRIQLIPVDGAGDGSPTAQAKRAMGGPRNDGRRDFSGLSSASTIEVPSDPAEPGHLGYGAPRPPTLVNDALAPHQPFDTSALHAQHGDSRRPETYATGDMWRKMGAFGTPVPFGTGNGQHESNVANR